ncbi:hypothetical protein [Pirellula sp. SH-Sr6A]|nr:hypothetical protein [Pirellula sp. SH-Sr6A]
MESSNQPRAAGMATGRWNGYGPLEWLRAAGMATGRWNGYGPTE